jgi:hypothetical protein
MMSIKDISVSKELDAKAMTDVRGGLTINSATVGTANQHVDNFNGGYGPSSSFALGVQEQNTTSVINAAEVNTASFGYLPYYW